MHLAPVLIPEAGEFGLQSLVHRQSMIRVAVEAEHD
jgi:hypothetical protein